MDLKIASSTFQLVSCSTLEAVTNWRPMAFQIESKTMTCWGVLPLWMDFLQEQTGNITQVGTFVIILTVDANKLLRSINNVYDFQFVSSLQQVAWRIYLKLVFLTSFVETCSAFLIQKCLRECFVRYVYLFFFFFLSLSPFL